MSKSIKEKLHSTLKNKKKSIDVKALRFFFDYGVRHGLTRRWRQGLSPAAAHCA